MYPKAILLALLSLAHFHLTLLTGAPYPALNTAPAALESALLALVLLTLGLRALAGRPAWPCLPRHEDEFGVALLRVATACLEASALAGLGNEVVGVVAPLAGGVLLLLGVAVPFSAGTAAAAAACLSAGVAAGSPPSAGVPGVGSEEGTLPAGTGDCDCRDEMETEDEATRCPLCARKAMWIRTPDGIQKRLM